MLVCRDLGMFVKCNKNQLCARLAEIPVSPGSRLTGLRFFHVIAFAVPAWLISPSSHQNQPRSGLPRFIASAINWAGLLHVIPDLKSFQVNGPPHLRNSQMLISRECMTAEMLISLKSGILISRSSRG